MVDGRASSVTSCSSAGDSQVGTEEAALSLMEAINELSSLRAPVPRSVFADLRADFLASQAKADGASLVVSAGWTCSVEFSDILRSFLLVCKVPPC